MHSSIHCSCYNALLYSYPNPFIAFTFILVHAAETVKDVS